VAEVKAGSEADFQHSAVQALTDLGAPGVHLRRSQHAVHHAWKYPVVPQTHASRIMSCCPANARSGPLPEWGDSDVECVFQQHGHCVKLRLSLRKSALRTNHWGLVLDAQVVVVARGTGHHWLLASGRTCKMVRRPSMPPNSPTVKSPNGWVGAAVGPTSEHPATVSRAAVASMLAARRPNLAALTTTP
jgi:hypothetical protein